MRKYALASLILAFLALPLVAAPVQAQQSTDASGGAPAFAIGPRVGLGGGFGGQVGAEARFGGGSFAVNPTIDLYFGGFSYVTLGLNGLLYLDFDNEIVEPYAGVGVGIVFQNDILFGTGFSDTWFGGGVIGGASFELEALENIKPFVQVQLFPYLDVDSAGGTTTISLPTLYGVTGGFLLTL
jgi:hypothetical protein